MGSPSSATGAWSATWPPASCPRTPATSSSPSSRSPWESPPPASTWPPPPRSARTSRAPRPASTGSPAPCPAPSWPRSSTKRVRFNVTTKSCRTKNQKRRSPPPNLYYLPPPIHISISTCHIRIEFFDAHLFLLPEDGARCGHFGHIVGVGSLYEEADGNFLQRKFCNENSASGRRQRGGNLRPRGERTLSSLSV